MIEEEIAKLQEYLQAGVDFKLPEFKELPNVPLYMEQVISYVNRCLSPLLSEEDSSITSFMVNNYVKAKVISGPEQKKYNEEHIGYLLAIAFLKKTLSMSEVGLLIRLDQRPDTDKRALYRFFKSMLEDVTEDTAKNANFHLKDLQKVFGKMEKEDPELAKRYLASSIAVLALRYSIKANVFEAIASKFLSSVAEITGDIPLHEAKEKSKKELKREEKNAYIEAERVGAYIEKGNKKRQQEELQKTQMLKIQLEEAERLLREEKEKKPEKASKAPKKANNKKEQPKTNKKAQKKPTKAKK